MRKFVSTGSGYRSTSTRIAVGLFTLLASHNALAGVPLGGTITYRPLSATAVPTMSGFALILLAALMLVVVARVLKSRQLNGTQFMLAALVTGAIASGASGIKLVSEANALALQSVTLTDPAGDTLSLDFGLNCVTNKTGITQQILDIQINTPPPANSGGFTNGGFQCPEDNGPNGGSPVQVSACSDSPPTILPHNATCAVEVAFPPV